MPITFIDDAEIYLAGEKCLLYASYICNDLDWTAKALDNVRFEHRLSHSHPLKWTLDAGDPKRTAAIKNSLVGRLFGPADWFLVSITRGTDKNRGFIQALEQAHYFHARERFETFCIIHDRACFTSTGEIEYAVSRLTRPHCNLFAAAVSKWSAGIVAVDIFAGAFRYMVHKHDQEKVPTVEGHPGIDIRLDELFWEIYRRSIAGRVVYRDVEGLEWPMNGFRDAAGIGVVWDQHLSEDQVKQLQPFTAFYLGCTL